MPSTETTGPSVLRQGAPGSPASSIISNISANAEWKTELARLIYLPPQRQFILTVPTVQAFTPWPDARNLANAIYTHRNNDTNEFHELNRTIQALFPEISGVITRTAGDNQVTLSLQDRHTNQPVSLEEAGTGVAQLLHLVACILMYEPGRIFLIDEPHAYLHPGTERELVAFLREHNEHSYLCATHSATLINAANPESTFLVTRDGFGTHMTGSSTSANDRERVLAELGVRPADVSLFERWTSPGSADTWHVWSNHIKGGLHGALAASQVRQEFKSEAVGLVQCEAPRTLVAHNAGGRIQTIDRLTFRWTCLSRKLPLALSVFDKGVISLSEEVQIATKQDIPPSKSRSLG